MKGTAHRRTCRRARYLAAMLGMLAGMPWSARGGVSDTPLPSFSDGKPALLAAVIPTVVKNNNVETAVICTNLAPAVVNVGLEVFDDTGARRNAFVAAPPAVASGEFLNVARGQTVTVSTGATVVLHEDQTLTLNTAGTGANSLQNGSGRVVATNVRLDCVALAVDKLHTIEDPSTCPTCQPPSLATLPLSMSSTIGTSTTTTTTTTSSTSTTLRSGGDQPVSGRKLLLKANPADPTGSVAKVLSKDPSLNLGGGNLSVDDPTLGGGTLRIVTSGGDAFDDTYRLPATNWGYIGPRGANQGYRYSDQLMSAGPITVVVLKGGKLKAVGKGSRLGHSLGGDPNPVTVVLGTGAKRYCATFGGATAFTVDRLYSAKDAAAPAACPP